MLPAGAIFRPRADLEVETIFERCGRPDRGGELSKNDLARIVKTLQDDDVVGFVAAMTERSSGVRYICRLRRS